jgi:hypothetical protein
LNCSKPTGVCGFSALLLLLSLLPFKFGQVAVCDFDVGIDDQIGRDCGVRSESMNACPVTSTPGGSNVPRANTT